MNKLILILPILIVSISLGIIFYPQEADAHGVPIYVVNTLDVYLDNTTVLNAGTAICTAVDLTVASTCGTDLVQGSTYRFEINVLQTGVDTAGIPTRFDAQSVIGGTDVFGTTPTYGSAGCDAGTPATDWSSSTVSTATQVDSGTTCSLAKTTGTGDYWFIVTIDSDGTDNTATFFITDTVTTDTSTTTTFTVVAGAGAPVYLVNTLDVYESESTTLNSGNAICTAVSLTSASPCNGILQVGHSYRFEVNVSEDTGVSGTPTTLDIDSAVADFDMAGNVVAGQITDSGCSTNTNWTESIVSTDIRATSGTGCVLNSSNADFWIILRIHSDAGGGAQPTVTFTIDDGAVSDVSTTTTFTVSNILE